MKHLFSFVLLVFFVSCTIVKANPIDSSESDNKPATRMQQNYPNPFNPTTTIQYTVADESMVQIVVWNLAGQKVAELVNWQVHAGTYEIEFDATELNSGVYMYSLDATSLVSNTTVRSVKRMTVIK